MVLGFLLLWRLGRGAAIAADLIVVLLPAVVLGVGLLSAATGVESTSTPAISRRSPSDAGPSASGCSLPPWSAPGAARGAGGRRDRRWLVTVRRVHAVVVVLGVARVVGDAAVVQPDAREPARRGGHRTVPAVRAGRGHDVRPGRLAVDAADRPATPRAGTPQRWATLADLARLTPPGQLGEAIARPDRPATAWVHLLLGIELAAAAGVGERDEHRASRAVLAPTRRWRPAARRERSIRSGRLLGRFLPTSPRRLARHAHGADQVPNATPGGQHHDSARHRRRGVLPRADARW